MFFSPRAIATWLVVVLVYGALVNDVMIDGAQAQSPAVDAPIDFAHEIVPILQKYCVECHGGREAKGSFSLNTRELLVDSGHVDVGKPAASYIMELIETENPDLQMPPPEKPRVSSNDRLLLRRWLASGLAWDDGFNFAGSTYEPPLKPRRPDLPAVTEGRNHPLDRIVDAYMARHEVKFPPPIDDATFLRRVSLDLVGLLPDPKTLKAFVADPSPDKRQAMIDQLLNEDIAYADHWLSFFNDLLRNDYSGTGFITGGRAQVSAWLYDSLRKNKPFDLMARELIAPPTASSRGYIDGIRWRGEVSAGQTVEIQFAQSVSQSFLGINMKCASCHDSFIDRWKLDEAFGLAAIYSEKPLEIHRCDKPIGRQAQASWLFPEIGQVDASQPRDERLRQLAALMTHPDNGCFSRTIVNRLWYKMMGRGIVHPLDAMQSEPWDEDLLDYLGVAIADNSYDLRATLKLIANSQIYQAASVVQTSEPGSEYVFRGPLPRRMTAEQFVDSVWQITQSAPQKIDAPVFRGDPQDESTAGLQTSAQWIWGDSAKDGQQPPAGETITLKKRFKLPAAVERGGAVITCDNEFVLFINGREAGRGSDWAKPQAIALHTLLKKGDNDVVIAATNAGNTPNPAGLFFEARMVLVGGEEVVMASDDSWEFSPKAAGGREGRLGAVSGPWSPVTIVAPVGVWTQAVQASVPGLLAQAISGKFPMVRASLIKNDFLMKSLGRPMREQIVSMRPTELTTLEAIDLSNGKTLANAIAVGAKRLVEQSENERTELVRYIFQFALSREPMDDELAAVNDYLSEPPTATEVEDVLWSVMMTPEYLLVR